MPDVLPNLEDLLVALPSGAAGTDAAALANTAAAAASWPVAVEHLHALAQTWTAR